MISRFSRSANKSWHRRLVSCCQVKTARFLAFRVPSFVFFTPVFFHLFHPETPGGSRANPEILLSKSLFLLRLMLLHPHHGSQHEGQCCLIFLLH